MPRKTHTPVLFIITGDGFRSENQVIVENGILRNFQLDQYGAKKLGKSRSVSEVMIAGNVGSMFHAINGISKDTINFGTAEHPWVRFGGIVVS